MLSTAIAPPPDENVPGTGVAAAHISSCRTVTGKPAREIAGLCQLMLDA